MDSRNFFYCSQIFPQSLPNKTHLWAVDVSLYLAVYIVTSCYRILKLFARDAHLRRLSKMVGHLPFTIV